MNYVGGSERPNLASTGQKRERSWEEVSGWEVWETVLVLSVFLLQFNGLGAESLAEMEMSRNKRAVFTRGSLLGIAHP